MDIWGKLRRNIEAAKGKYQASVEEYDAVLVNVIADVADRYTDYRVAEKQVADISRLAGLQRESLKIAQAQFEEGIKSELDVSQSKLNLANTEALIPTYERLSRVASNALCVLLGIAAEDLHDRLGDQDIPTTPPNCTRPTSCAIAQPRATPINPPIVSHAIAREVALEAFARTRNTSTIVQL